MLTLKLAQVALFLDQLGVVVFAVQPTLMRNVVGWAYRAPSMGAFETALVICCSIHGNLKTYTQFVTLLMEPMICLPIVSIFTRTLPSQWDRQYSYSPRIYLWFPQTCWRLYLPWVSVQKQVKERVMVHIIQPSVVTKEFQLPQYHLVSLVSQFLGSLENN